MPLNPFVPKTDAGDAVAIDNNAGETLAIDDGGGSITVDGSVSVSNFPATQPVSGTVTANQGTPNTTANAWPAKVTDGTNTATVTAGGLLKVDGSSVTQPVSGTVTANAGSGTFTVGQATGTNLHSVIDSGSITVSNAAGASAVNIQDGGNSITVDGTIATTFPSSSSSAVTSVASSATNVTLLASNASRKMATFYNDSTKGLFLKLGTTASATSFTTKLNSGDYYELPLPVYTGQIDGIWASANGSARITELT